MVRYGWVPGGGVVGALLALFSAQTPCVEVNPFVVACGVELATSPPQTFVEDVAACVDYLELGVELDRGRTARIRWFSARELRSPLPFPVLAASGPGVDAVFVLRGAPSWVYAHEIVHALLNVGHGDARDGRLHRAIALCGSDRRARGERSTQTS